MKRVYTIFTEDHITQVTAVAGTMARYEQGTGVIELELDEEICTYLFNLTGNYTLFQLQATMLLQSKYSNGIYEMLAQFKEQYKNA